jgi:Tfp pilus assembly protein PilV
VLVIAIAAAGLSVPALAVVALVAMVLTLGLLAYHLRHLARHSAARWRGASEQLKGQRQP